MIGSEQSSETPAVSAFRRTHYPDISDDDWNDWHWQMRHRLRDEEALARIFTLSESEKIALRNQSGNMPMGCTPYYAALMDPTDVSDPLRRTKIPVQEEDIVSPGEMDDPLGEDDHMTVPGLVHTYPDKALLLATDFCATYCRYCTRGRMVGKGEYLPDMDTWEEAAAYIESHPSIRDVLISGGDPLIMSDGRLEKLLARIHSIKHVEIIRIGTKVPAVLPARITPELVAMLKKYHPLYMSIHFIHPNEFSAECRAACERLADAGIPLAGQMVLLKGINDDVETMRTLVKEQLRCRVKPYYLHQCDQISGSAHFRTSVESGTRLIEKLHGHTTGYAVPMYMIDAPGGGGKVPVSPNYVVGREGDELILRNYEGNEFRYFDPV